MDSFITSIHIEKVRHLTGIDIKLSENERKHLILTGKNGSGKTSVLTAIKDFFRVFDDVNYDEIMYYPQSISASLKRISMYENDINMTENSKSSRIRELRRTIILIQSTLDKYYKGLKVDFNSQSDIYMKYINGDFILAYFDAKRFSSIEMPSSVEKISLQERNSIDNLLSPLFVKYLVDLKTQQAFAKNENDLKEVEKITLWFDNFEKSLKSLFEDENLRLDFDYKNYNFSIRQSGRELFGFDALSDGYSAFLNILMDLILRMEYKRSGKYDIEGIVLIDEIETHLHIALQKKILPFLTSFFPRVQFIVTTHSPFVLNSIKNAVIFDLENQLQVEDLSAYSYEGIVEGYFKADMYSDEVKEKLKRYEELVMKAAKNEDENDEMIGLRFYLKEVPEGLAKEMVAKFREIELKRKGGL